MPQRRQHQTLWSCKSSCQSCSCTCWHSYPLLIWYPTRSKLCTFRTMMWGRNCFLNFFQVYWMFRIFTDDTQNRKPKKFWSFFMILQYQSIHPPTIFTAVTCKHIVDASDLPLNKAACTPGLLYFHTISIMLLNYYTHTRSYQSQMLQFVCFVTVQR